MFDDSGDIRVAKIKVIGVGGGGNNAVNRMIDKGITTAEFFAINTDKQALMLSKAPIENRLQIGERITKGLGAGSQPELGEAAAEESKDEIAAICENTDLLFIAAGMGGGTGTGAAPVIAKIAKEKGCLTVACITKPFSFEGKKRSANAVKGIANLSKYVDTIIIIPNDKILEALPPDTPFLEAFSFADDTLRQGVCGIADLISTPALINLDFADVHTILNNQGLAHMGVGRSKGENRIVEAVKQAVSSPMLETTIEGATGAILNVTGGNDLTIGQVNECASLVQNVIDEGANIIFGANVNPDLNEEVVITIIATGFNNAKREEKRSQMRYSAPQAPERQLERGLYDESTQPEPEEKPFFAEAVEAQQRESVVRHEEPTPEPYVERAEATRIRADEPYADEKRDELSMKEPDKKELPFFVRKFLGRKK